MSDSAPEVRALFGDLGQKRTPVCVIIAGKRQKTSGAVGGLTARSLGYKTKREGDYRSLDFLVPPFVWMTGLETKTFQDINVKYLKGYMDFCTDNGNSDSTIKIRLGEIRRIFNIAIRDGVASQELYPFSSGKEDGKIRIPKTAPTKTDQYLTLDSMRKLANTQMKNHVSERTRHLFLFSYYCRGMNWKDMALLSKSSFLPMVVTDESTKESKEVTMMEYRRSKTKGEFLIQITPNIQRELDWFAQNTVLFEDYALPIISVEVPSERLDMYIAKIRQRFNASLKKIAKQLKFPESQQNITIYTARHSFAMTLKNKDKSLNEIYD